MNIFKRLFNNQKETPLSPNFYIGKKDEIKIPNARSFDCEISTPQFHGSQDKFHLHKQCGTYYKSEMKFYPFVSMFGYPTNGDHTVQFHNQNDIKKAIVRLL